MMEHLAATAMCNISKTKNYCLNNFGSFIISHTLQHLIIISQLDASYVASDICIVKIHREIPFHIYVLYLQVITTFASNFQRYWQFLKIDYIIISKKCFITTFV